MLPIYVINLKESTARRKSIQAQLEILDLKFEFFDAIDGRKGFTEAQKLCFDRKKAKEIHNRVLTDTEIACAMTHALLCKKIAESDHKDGAIILEDDVALSDDFAELLSGKKLQDSKEDLVVFYHRFCYIYPWAGAKFFKNYWFYKPAHLPSSTVAYYVSQKGAGAIFEKSWPICCVADWGFDIRTIGAKMIMPRIVDHIEADLLPSIVGKRAGRPQPSRLQRLHNFSWIGFKLRRIFMIKVS